MPIITTKTRSLLLARSGTALIFPPSGTVLTDGTITLGATLPQIYSRGAWVRLPAGAITSVGGGAAGLYWCVFSSTTVGQFKNNYASPASLDALAHPASVGTNATGSNVAYTQDTASDITMATVPVAGGSLGVNGGWTGDISFSNSNSASTKRVWVKFGEVDVVRLSLTTSISGRTRPRISNQGAETLQLAQSPVGTAANSASTFNSDLARLEVDTTVAQNITIGVLLPLADIAVGYVIIEFISIELLP